jgi:LL-diaminopimelate aminotransferase
MIRINEHFNKLHSSYLFSDIAQRVAAFRDSNPDIDIIKMGIGDVTRALPPACIEGFHRAVDEMAGDETFRGYGPEQGYAFLREAIAANDFQARGADIDADEVFISDGAKCDTGNFQELLDTDITIAIPDPVYPAYVDANVMAGRTGPCEDGRYRGLVYLESTQASGYLPSLPQTPVDCIYLCFPNNPTGAVASKEYLSQWVSYAHEHDALLLFDAAYEAFIRQDTIPHSIFELPGAREVAVEFRSFSKTAGFTGTRCAYTVVPRECRAFTKDKSPQKLHPLWLRRQSTKFNGVSYPVQCAAHAVYSEDGRRQVTELIDYYLANARSISTTMEELGFSCTGGIDSPYVWVHTNQESMELFDMLLSKAGVVCTPGTGFGRCGKNHIRLSAFNSHENVSTAMDRLRTLFSHA